MKFRVDMKTEAWCTVTVEVDDEKYKDLPEEEREDAMREDAVDLAYEDLPGGVCAQCSGWDTNWGLSLGEEWDLGENTKEYPNPLKVDS